jgi:hypothetical protein
MTYNNHYQHDLYRAKITQLIAKNINLRRDVDELLKRNEVANNNLSECIGELHAALELNRSLSASIARLVVENHELEYELDRWPDEVEG